MSDNWSEFFGPQGARPNHPDFWRLSEIVLSFDGRMDAATTNEEKEGVWNDTVGQLVDQKSLAYMAMQRAFHVAGIEKQSDMFEPGKADMVARLTTVYMEGFLMGSTFQQRGGKQ